MDLMIDYPRQRVVDVGFDHLKIALAVFPAAAGDGDLVILDPDNGKRAITVLVGPGVIDLINRIATIVLYAWDVRMANQERGDVILVEQVEQLVTAGLRPPFDRPFVEAVVLDIDNRISR